MTGCEGIDADYLANLREQLPRANDTLQVSTVGPPSTGQVWDAVGFGNTLCTRLPI